MGGDLSWSDDLIDVLKRPEDYTPALPFIQEFENPQPFITRSSYTIGEYADYSNISPLVNELANDMAFNLSQSVNAIVEAAGGADGEAAQAGSSIAFNQETQSSAA